MILILVTSLFFVLGGWTLQKAQDFYTAGDGENFKKWKTINTVVIVSQWVVSLAIICITYIAVNSMY